MEQRFNKLTQRLAELEQAFCNQSQIMTQTIAELSARYESLAASNEALRVEHEQLVERYNSAANAINAIDARTAALEANYDPTIIG